MIFGKRGETPAKPGGAPVQQQRPIPAEIWYGKDGDFLRKLGMSLDDESNLVPSRESVEARPPPQPCN